MPITLNGSTGLTANDGSVFTNASGNVGIGTTSPSNKLDIVGSAARISNAGTANFATRNSTAGVNWEWGVDGGGNGFIYTGQVSGMTISTNAAARVNITSNGARQFTSQSQASYYAGDATFTLSNSTITFDLATVFPDLIGNGAGMGIMLLINQWNGGGGSGITQLTLGQKSGAWSFSTIATAGSGSGSSVSGSGTVITVTAGAGFGQVRVWVTSRN